jgi:modulator of FtsH protease
MQLENAVSRAPESILQTNKLIKNTYILLSMTLIFAAFTAFVSVSAGISHGIGFVSSIIAIGMLWFVLPKTANSGAGIPVIFAITGLFGFGLGPMLSYYLSVNPSIVMTALGGTGAIFLGLSGYALTTRKDFSFLGGFVMIGMLVVFGAAILNIFLGIPALFLAINAAVVLIMSAFILWETSSLVNGGETNYIMAAAGLFLSILNMFQALLHLLGAFGGDD